MSYTDDNKADLRKHCIAVARAVLDNAYPGGVHKDFESPLLIFENDTYWNALCYLWKLSEMGPTNNVKLNWKGKGLDVLIWYLGRS